MGIDCVGSCPIAETCDKRTSTYSGGTYEQCACTNGTPSSCCHLILVKPDAGSPYLAVRGNCPDCGTSGVCTYNTATQQAVCQ